MAKEVGIKASLKFNDLIGEEIAGVTSHRTEVHKPLYHDAHDRTNFPLSRKLFILENLEV